jgi:hypothetical protein
MIIGDCQTLAIESEVSRAYSSRSLLGLGHFLVHVGGTEYGVRAADATMLACSFDAVRNRLRARGNHVASFAEQASAHEIACAYRDAIYSDEPVSARYFGLSVETFQSELDASRAVWAPDGDAAFDDGSHVLQFDLGIQVRLVAFRTAGGNRIEALSDVAIPGDAFYQTLEDWLRAFEMEWDRADKCGSERFE